LILLPGANAEGGDFGGALQDDGLAINAKDLSGNRGVVAAHETFDGVGLVGGGRSVDEQDARADGSGAAEGPIAFDNQDKLHAGEERAVVFAGEEIPREERLTAGSFAFARPFAVTTEDVVGAILYVFTGEESSLVGESGGKYQKK
jgi:hypothetical protein